MAMFHDDPVRPAAYERFVRPVPPWWRGAGLGVFVHWGPYSVPAWAETSGALGTIAPDEWYAHNAYAEWYANTIRIDGSPAQRHHREVHGGAPYDDFLDAWRAEHFDADAWASVFAAAGAGYVVLTTKHHDGVTLWDAPGTGTRNTVHRGPQRDLVAEVAAAVRRRGMRFGAYYSGGLDWHAAPSVAIDEEEWNHLRPHGAEYAAYATAHVEDLIDRYAPEVLWGDIGWPDAGCGTGPLGFDRVLDRFYAAAPEGVVNDRWGLTHWDARTSEYAEGRGAESGGGAWETCRGTGLSFGYNRNETAEDVLDGPGAVRELVDVVSRGGNLLLDVGPDAAGSIPALQLRSLEGLAAWRAVAADAVSGAGPLPAELGRPGEAPWTRWTLTGRTAHAVVDARGAVVLDADPAAFDLTRAEVLGAGPVLVTPVDRPGGGLSLELPAGLADGPVAVRLPLRG